MGTGHHNARSAVGSLRRQPPGGDLLDGVMHSHPRYDDLSARPRHGKRRLPALPTPRSRLPDLPRTASQRATAAATQPSQRENRRRSTHQTDETHHQGACRTVSCWSRDNAVRQQTQQPAADPRQHHGPAGRPRLDRRSQEVRQSRRRRRHAAAPNHQNSRCQHRGAGVGRPDPCGVDRGQMASTAGGATTRASDTR